ncbi:MAG: CpsD/CapB family tyrosine-protein kinase, partial [Bacteroidales bacterium]|nr:CpsD/CapB family tyrosine-protein kinase [Bacteroidales bacterium]
GEGKTFCATNLATIFSMSGKKTLLMGLDMRKPKIHKVFNISNDKGISSFLIGQDSFQDIIHPTSQENLFVAPSGPVPPNPAELIETEKMKSLMELVKNEFDTIILDTPPVAIVTDPILLARFSDVNIFIVRQNYSTKNVVQLIDDLQHKIKFKKLGILINDIKLNGYFGYGYNYGYGYGYGYGYDQDYYGEDGGKSKFRRVLDSFKGVKS